MPCIACRARTRGLAPTSDALRYLMPASDHLAAEALPRGNGRRRAEHRRGLRTVGRALKGERARVPGLISRRRLRAGLVLPVRIDARRWCRHALPRFRAHTDPASGNRKARKIVKLLRRGIRLGHCGPWHMPLMSTNRPAGNDHQRRPLITWRMTMQDNSEMFPNAELWLAAVVSCTPALLIAVLMIVSLIQPQFPG